MSYDYPRCCSCKQEKVRSEFYKRPNSDYVTSECKECMKARSKRHKRIDRKVSVVPSEGEVINQLSKLGIPALPGKALGHQWADVLAYGAVMIEVKSSALRSKQFTFAFTDTQRKRLRGDLVVLVCRYDDHSTFHVFASNHPMFWKADGNLRKHITYTPNRDKRGQRSILTDNMMTAAQDNWQLVRDYLQQISDRLRFGEQLPILLHAA